MQDFDMAGCGESHSPLYPDKIVPVTNQYNLYEEDFVAWAELQALLLEAENYQSLDLPNLIEEVRDMSKRILKVTSSQLEHLIMHLLKIKMQPEYPDKESWIRSIKQARVELEEAFNESTVLKNRVLASETLARCYSKAVKEASIEMELFWDRVSTPKNSTDIPVESFPQTLPYTVEQLLDENYFG